MPNDKMIEEIWQGWKIGPEIGRGSYGTVYEIERDKYGEKSALKVITIPKDGEKKELENDGYDAESIAKRFEEHSQDIVKEYTMMANLKGCANIVHCEDVLPVQHNDGIGWDIFIRMELLKALPETLGTGIPEEQIVRIGMDICSALSYCEKRNLLHRDIKPQNIFLAPDGTYKLGDFGIAKATERTTGGTKTGTYKYMAPEVYNSQPYGRKADIYSLGLVLYWLLNERRMPFHPLPPSTPTYREEEAAKERRFGGEKIPEPAHGSEGLKQIVLRACEYDPKDRYQSAEKMKRELEKIHGREESNNIIPLPQTSDQRKGEAGSQEATRDEKETETTFSKEEKRNERGTEPETIGSTAEEGPPKEVYQEKDYRMAQRKMEAKEWNSAAEIFERLGGYKNAKELAKKCRKTAEKEKRKKTAKIVVIIGGAILLIALIIYGIYDYVQKKKTIEKVTPSPTTIINTTPTPTPTPTPISTNTPSLYEEYLPIPDWYFDDGVTIKDNQICFSRLDGITADDVFIKFVHVYTYDEQGKLIDRREFEFYPSVEMAEKWYEKLITYDYNGGKNGHGYTKEEDPANYYCVDDTLVSVYKEEYLKSEPVASFDSAIDYWSGSGWTIHSIGDENAAFPTSRPSAADLDAIHADIVYPKKDSYYLDSYETKYVQASKGKDAVYSYKDPDAKKDIYRAGNRFTVYNGTEARVIARAAEYSCVIFPDLNKAGWINSDYLVS